MTCKYSFFTESPWFLQKTKGAKTVRCYLPNAITRKVAGGIVRFATVGDTFDLTKPAKTQILEDAPYVCVRECKCNQKDCPYWTKKEDK